MISRFSPIPADAREAALWWAAKINSDPQRYASDARFERWLEGDENSAAWNELQEQDALLASFAIEPEIRAMRKEALEKIEDMRPASIGWVGYGAIAASLVVAVFGATYLSVPATDPTIEASGSRVLRYETEHAQRRDVGLSDGSQIALNSETAIEVDYSQARRRVQLLRGQALFRVAKDASRPFVVQAGDQTITATGTAFDVTIEADGNVRVLLVEGSVEVEPIKREGFARIIPGLATHKLEPGQELLAVPLKDVTIGSADIEQGTAWNRGIIILRDAPLDQAIKEFNRYSEKPIVLETQRLRSLRVSGVFPTGREEDFFAAIEAMHNVSIEETEGALTLTEARSK